MSEVKEMSGITLHELNGGTALEVHITAKLPQPTTTNFFPTSKDW